MTIIKYNNQRNYLYSNVQIHTSNYSANIKIFKISRHFFKEMVRNKIEKETYF